MKAAFIKLKNILRMYQVAKYPAPILKAKENDWLKRVEMFSEEIQELVSVFLDHEFITDEDRFQADNLMEMFMNQVSDYMLAYLTKINGIGSGVQVPANGNDETSGGSNSPSASLESSSSSASVVNQAVKTAKVNVDIEVEKISKEVKSLPVELRKFGIWFEVATVSGPNYIGLVERKLRTIEETSGWFEIWNVSELPKMIPKPRWFKVKQGDVIMFQKVANELSSDWPVGQIESAVRFKDGAIRRVEVRYHHQHDKEHKFTDRAVRSLVRLFHIEDKYYIEVDKIISNLENKAMADEENIDKVKPLSSVQYSCVNIKALAVLMSEITVIELPLDEDDDAALQVQPLPVGPHPHDEVLAVLTALKTQFDPA